MVFYENGKKVRYNPCHMKFNSSCGEGDESIAYQVGDEVVKFYREYCHKRRLSKESCDYLKQIDTKRILLPRVSLLDKKHQIRGYKMTYIEKLEENSFYTLDRKDLSKEMSFIHEDVVKLSDYNVYMDDLTWDNTVFHKGIYLVDPGSFQIVQLEEGSNIRIYGFNLDTVNEYLLYKIIKQCFFRVSQNSIGITRGMIYSIKEDMKEKGMDILTYLIDGMEYDSIMDLAIHKYNEFKFGSHEKIVGIQKIKK